MPIGIRGIGTHIPLKSPTRTDIKVLELLDWFVRNVKYTAHIENATLMQKLMHSDNKNTKNAPKLTGNVIPTPAGKKMLLSI